MGRQTLFRLPALLGAIRPTARDWSQGAHAHFVVGQHFGIPIIDAYAAFQAHRDPLSLFPFRGPGHYNEAGHRVVRQKQSSTLSHIVIQTTSTRDPQPTSCQRDERCPAIAQAINITKEKQPRCVGL